MNIKKNKYAFKKKKHTYGTLLLFWLRQNRRNLKESSYARYVQLITTHILPALGGFKVEEITTQKLEVEIERMLFCGKINSEEGLSPKMVADIFSIIKASMAWCKNRGYRLCCEPTKIRIRKNVREMRVLGTREQKRLQETLLSNMEHYKLGNLALGILTTLFTGMRIGELCGLRWDDIDLKEQVLHIKRTVQRIKNLEGGGKRTRILISTPKSNASIRKIPITDCLMPYLTKYESDSKHYMLTGTPKYVEPRLVQYHFKRFVEESSIENVNFHALRHTFATRCIEAQFDVKTLSEILGHSDVNVTLNRYVHSSYQLKKESMNKLSFL